MKSCDKSNIPLVRVYALGFFDGVHLGHQALLKACCELAQHHNAEPCAITFQQHPQSLFTKNPPKLINTIEARLSLLQQYGMQSVLSYPVDKETMSTPWEVFLTKLLHSGAVGFVCGEDFRFGRQGEGDAQKLVSFCKERNLDFRIVEDQMLDHMRISSTHIRQLIEQGEMEQAVRFLGHPHVLSGTVICGQKLGRTIGIPTANLSLADDTVCPMLGVYACKARVDSKEYLAVTNIGNRPTVNGQHITVEAWLLDFTGDLYGKTLTLSFYKFLRPEQKFDSLEELATEIQKNALQTRKIFENS